MVQAAWLPFTQVCTIIVVALVKVRAQEACLLSVGQKVSKVLPAVDADADPAKSFQSEAAGQHIDASELLCQFQKHAQGMELNLVKVLYELQKWPSWELDSYPKKCAVVSNSGVLLNHRHGAEIDAADMVFRFNDAVIGGELREIVGEKEHVRFLCGMHTLGVFHDNTTIQRSSETLYVLQRLYPFQQPDTYTQVEKESNAHPWLHVVTGNNKAEELGERIFQAVYGGELERKLTTGFMGLLVAMRMCEEVRAYGFAESIHSPDAPFHYFGHLKQGSASKNSIHVTAEREKLLWRSLATNQDVDATEVAVIPGFRSLQCGGDDSDASSLSQTSCC